MTKYSLLLLGTVLCLFSCVEDEGTYDLQPVNEVTIEGLDENGYSVLSNVDVLYIEADIIGSLTEKNAPDAYEYSWFLIDAEGSKQEIGTERILNYEVALAPGTYTLYLEVLDKGSRLKWMEHTSLSVSTEMTTGFLVLGDREDGSAELDMIAIRAGRDTILMKDLLLGEKVKGAERLIFAGRPRSGGYQTLWLTTQEKSYALTNGSYFKVMEGKTFESMLYTEFNIKRPVRVLDMFPRQYSGGTARNTSSRGYITEDAVYAASMLSGGQVFGNPINRYSSMSDELFQPYHLAFCQGSAYLSSFYLPCIYYDMTHQCFVTTNLTMAMSITNCVSLSSKDADGDLFPWDQKNTTRKLIYGQNGYHSMGYSYALMRDDENQWFVYRFIVNRSSTIPAKNGAWPIDLNIAVNFDKASMYAFSSSETEILYAVGSELWGYDYERKIAAKLKDFGDEIILLEPEGQSQVGVINDFFVATAPESYQSTLYKIKMLDNPNAVEMEEIKNFKFTINARIKAIEWKNAPDQSNEEKYF